ncbi:MAG: hypothetical protein PHT44_04185 [Candidatus Portnoybacteria bacterium]|nr:hypothetical protein [Candidatus Portnoybacteria bacterium]MDD4983179.1 hypothetical protein [Candidatus Portnoybacteria bacterium]
MKFRNVSKRRPWKTKAQKKEKNRREAAILEKERSEALSREVKEAIENRWPAGAARSIIERYHLDDFPPTAVSPRQKIPVSPGAKESWIDYFALRLYRLRRFVLWLWAMARFQRVGAWLPER